MSAETRVDLFKKLPINERYKLFLPAKMKNDPSEDWPESDIAKYTENQM